MTKTILCVDDSVAILYTVSTLLKGAGYMVVEAKDGLEGLEKARQRTADVVITDQNMPRMDGLTLVRNLRALPEYQKTPILMLTSESDAAIKQQCRESGASGWMSKPLNPDKLLEVVKRMSP